MLAGIWSLSSECNISASAAIARASPLFRSSSINNAARGPPLGLVVRGPKKRDSLTAFRKSAQFSGGINAIEGRRDDLASQFKVCDRRLPAAVRGACGRKVSRDAKIRGGSGPGRNPTRQKLETVQRRASPSAWRQIARAFSAR